MQKIGHDFDYIFSYRWLLKKNMLETLSAYGKKYGHGILLDIGCGDKPYKKLFSHLVDKFIGLDTNKIPNKADIHGSILALPFKNKTIDTILCVWVLDDVPEPNLVFSEISRVLKKNGKFLLVANQSDTLHFQPNDYFRFTKYAINYLSEKNNMQVMEYKQIGGFWIMIGFKLISYFKKASNKIFFLRPSRPLVYPIINMAFFILDKIHSPKHDIIGNVYTISKN